MSELASDPVDQLIAGRYRVESVIGRGGQGIVCRAHDDERGCAVAIKVLSDASSRDPQVAGRFLREQAALQALSGTSAVQVLDAGRTGDGSLYLVLELLQGRDLEQELAELEVRGEHVSPRRIAEILNPIASTLDAAHQKGIFHRDLKPANVYLLSGGGVRLLDFGFARLRSSQPLTAVGVVMGSPSYIAPEMWRGRPDLVDHRVDVYALGVMAFRMLSGTLPFEAAALGELLVLTTTAPRPSLVSLRPDLPPGVDAWVQRALAVKPGERFATVAAMLEGLFIALGAEGVLAEVRAVQCGAHDEQRASAAERIVHALSEAAAKLKRWTARNSAAPKALNAAKPKPAPKATKSAPRAPSLPVVPKLSARARPSRPPPAPPPTPRATRGVPPPEYSRVRAQPLPASAKDLRRGVLPPPPSVPVGKNKR